MQLDAFNDWLSRFGSADIRHQVPIVYKKYGGMLSGENDREEFLFLALHYIIGAVNWTEFEELNDHRESGSSFIQPLERFE